MDDEWTSLTDHLAGVLSSMRLGQFLVLEYDAQLEQVEPYAQAARELDGYYCEVVSEDYLPRDQWPILLAAMERAGWHEPAGPDENWSCSVDDDPVEASERLLSGLREGRVCRDPSRFSWRVGTFPPGPDGGELVPVWRWTALRAA